MIVLLWTNFGKVEVKAKVQSEEDVSLCFLLKFSLFLNLLFYLYLTKKSHQQNTGSELKKSFTMVGWWGKKKKRNGSIQSRDEQKAQWTRTLCQPEVS